MPCSHFELLMTHLVDVEKTSAIYIALAFNDPQKLFERKGTTDTYAANRRKLAALLGSSVRVQRKEE